MSPQAFSGAAHSRPLYGGGEGMVGNKMIEGASLLVELTFLMVPAAHLCGACVHFRCSLGGSPAE